MGTIAGVSLFAYPVLGTLWPWLMRPRQDSTGWKIIHIFVYALLIYFQFVQYFLATVGWEIKISDNFQPLSINSSIIFPLGLTAILHAYITHEPDNFRRLCVSLLIANAAMVLAIVLRRNDYLSSLTRLGWEPLWSEGAISILLIGLCIQAIDVVIIIWVHTKIYNNTTNMLFSIILPLLIALVIDAAGFSLVIAHYRGRTPWTEFLNQLSIKIIAGMIYAFWLSEYFSRFDGTYFSESPIKYARRFFLEALPYAHNRRIALAGLTRTGDYDSSIGLMPERGSKDAARGVPEKQESTPETQGRRQGGFVAALGQPADLEPRQIIAEGVAAFQRDLPELFKAHPDEWVAYHGDKRLGIAATRAELYKLIQEENRDRRDVLTRLIDENSLYDTGVYDSSANTLN